DKAAGQSVPTNQGYADDLFAAAHARFPSLRLVKLGCPGESTGTMIHSGICSYPHGSQLAEATNFLHAHHKFVAFVTIDLASNDIDTCLRGGAPNQACIAAGSASTQANLPQILQALRSAAGPGVPILGMDYYDPFLAAWLQGPSGQALAQATVQIRVNFNA